MADLLPLLPSKLPANAPSVFPPIGDAPPIAQAAMGGGLHSLLGIPASTLPSVTENPRISAVSSDPLITRKDHLESDLYNRTNPVKPTTTLGKIGHVASGIGNVLGDIFAPETMALIHGTDLNNQVIEARDKHDLDQVSQLQTAESGRKQQAAQTAYTEQRPEIEQAKLQQKMDLQRVKSDQAAAKAGQKPVEDADGNVSYVDDPDSAAYQSRKVHDDTEQARQGMLAAQAEVDRTKNDPNSPAYKLALTRAEIARQNASAAITRAQAYYGNYLQGAFNKDLNGNVLPGAPQISDGSGNTTTVGSKNATQAVNANTRVSQFNDVGGALDSVEDTATKLTAAGGKLNSPAVIAALQIPHGTISQWIHSVNKANLTPEERDYVLSNIAMHENIQGLRKSAGGGATDSQVANLLNMAPSGSTPDLDYLKRQTGQIRATATRLGKGVTTAQGGLTVNTGSPKEGEIKTNSAGDKIVFKGGKWGPA